MEKLRPPVSLNIRLRVDRRRYLELKIDIIAADLHLLIRLEIIRRNGQVLNFGHKARDT